MSIGLGKQTSASVPTPPSTELNLFFDSSDDKLKKKDSSGTVTNLEVGGVSSFNSRTGAVVPLAGDYTKSDVGLGNVPNLDATNPSNITQDVTHRFVTDIEKSTWNSKLDAIAGGSSRLVNKNSSGDVESLETHSISSKGGIDQSLIISYGGASGYDFINRKRPTINVTANDPAASLDLNNVYVDIDLAASGFDLGAGGDFLKIYSSKIKHTGKSDVGSLRFILNDLEIGNGTDAFSVKGIDGFSLGGEIKNNITLNDGYVGAQFSTHFYSSSVIDSTSGYFTIFQDSMNIEAPCSWYTSASLSPTITSFQDNRGFTGINVGPTITNFGASGWFTGISCYASVTNISNGGFKFLDINPTISNITSNGYYATLSSYPTITSANKSSNIYGIQIKPTVNGSKWNVGIDIDSSAMTAYVGYNPEITEQDLKIEINSHTTDIYTLEYIDDTTAGSETASIAGLDIKVHIESGVSTATQVKAALDAAGGINIIVTIIGAASNPQTSFSAKNFTAGDSDGQVYAGRFKGDVYVDGDFTYTGLLTFGRLTSFYNQTLVSGGINPVSVNSLICGMSLGDNQTITSADTIGLNTAALVSIGTNSSVTTNVVGLSAMALPAVVTVGSGSTVDVIAGCTFAVSMGGGSGTVDKMYLARNVAIPDGTTTVNNLYGCAVDLPYGTIATNNYGIYVSPNIFNYMSSNLLIGGTAYSDDKVSNSNVALEIKSTTKAMLFSRMTTAERDAMTAIDGMVVYNTTRSKLQARAGGSWFDLH